MSMCTCMCMCMCMCMCICMSCSCCHVGAGPIPYIAGPIPHGGQRLHLTRAQRELSLVARRSSRRAHGAAAAAAGLHSRGDERVVRAAAQRVETLVE